MPRRRPLTRKALARNETPLSNEPPSRPSLTHGPRSDEEHRAREQKALEARRAAADPAAAAVQIAPCNPELLAPYNSHGVPPFVERGYYADTAFDCATCRKREVWRATRQKWWYEVVKGNVESRAKLCNACQRV